MTELLALGASHKTAPLAVRERLTLLDGQVEPFLQELLGHAEISEAVAVSTCTAPSLTSSRTTRGGQSAVLGSLPRRATRPTAAGVDLAAQLRRRAPVPRRERVEPMIVGEAEIQGVKACLRARRTRQAADQQPSAPPGRQPCHRTDLLRPRASPRCRDAPHAVPSACRARRVRSFRGRDGADGARSTEKVSTMFAANRFRDRAIARRALRRLGLVTRCRRSSRAPTSSPRPPRRDASSPRSWPT
jgi:glutamyl-tRNA reductase